MQLLFLPYLSDCLCEYILYRKNVRISFAGLRCSRACTLCPTESYHRVSCSVPSNAHTHPITVCPHGSAAVHYSCAMSVPVCLPVF